MAYIVLPNIAWQRLLETGLDNLWAHPPIYILSTPTYFLSAPAYDLPKPKNQPKINFSRPFPWPLLCTKVGPISLSKLRHSAQKGYNVQKCGFALKTMDLLANPNKIDENTLFWAQ